VYEGDGSFVIYPDYRDPPGLRSAAGSYALSTYPSGLIEALKGGQMLSVSDTIIDALTAPFQTPIYEPLDVRAFVSVPLIRNGRLAGTLSAGRQQPHVWGVREIALLQALAEHVWNALEASP
jgi:GAF domain-containing protein